MMIDVRAFENTEFCITDALRNGMPGDVIETGVWRGGAAIFMKAVLDVNGSTDRNVWVADSFHGLPKPNAEKYPADKEDKFWTQTLAVSEEVVRRNFERYGLLDDRVTFLVGFSSDTISNAPIEKLAVLRLDGDMYESTYVVLEQLYPKLSVGGYVIIDNYGMVPACKQATEDHRAVHFVMQPIQVAQGAMVFWRRSA